MYLYEVNISVDNNFIGSGLISSDYDRAWFRVKRFLLFETMFFFNHVPHAQLWVYKISCMDSNLGLNYINLTKLVLQALFENHFNIPSNSLSLSLRSILIHSPFPKPPLLFFINFLDIFNGLRPLWLIVITPSALGPEHCPFYYTAFAVSGKVGSRKPV